MSKEHERPEPQPAPLTLEQVAQLSVEILVQAGYHVPTLVVDGNHHPLIVQLSALAPTPAERAKQLYVAGAVLAREGGAGRLRRVFFVSEAWVSVTDADKFTGASPVEDPARKEALAISSYEAATRHADLVLYEMVRDDEGALREVREFEVEGVGGDTESPLLEAFVVGYTGDTTYHTGFSQNPDRR
jgi:hypothetical protein